MFNKDHKLYSIQVILILLIVLVVLNMITIYMQSSMTSNVVNIKNDHLKSTNEVCDILVRRYERRAMDLAYRNMTVNDFENTLTMDTDNIPPENIVYVKLKDNFTLPVAYFDESGFLQSLILPNK